MSEDAVRLNLAGLERLAAAICRCGHALYAPVHDGPEGGWKRIEPLEPLALKDPPARGPKRIFSHASHARLVFIGRTNGSWQIRQETATAPKLALFGFHACSLETLRRLDRVLLGDRFPTPTIGHSAGMRSSSPITASKPFICR